MPYSRFESVLDDLKKEHPKARHFVYAYRFLNSYAQIVEIVVMIRAKINCRKANFSYFSWKKHWSKCYYYG